MEWPPYSPDLNPIEHCWFPLGEGFYDVWSLLDEYKGEVYLKEWLQGACVESWSGM